MARQYKVKINADGKLTVNKKAVFSYEHNATRLVCTCDTTLKDYDKYIDFENAAGTFQSELIDSSNTTFNYDLPQNLTKSELKFQFVFKESTIEIMKSNIETVPFEESLNATEILPETIVEDLTI